MTGCALTGHRKLPPDPDVKKLQEKLVSLIGLGVDVFYCGMAVGFDLLACSLLLRLKRDYSFRVVACVPCPGQEKHFSEEEKAEYYRLLDRVNEVVVVSDHYFPDVFGVRNRYMVDRADVVLSYCVEKKGGTVNTIAYAKKKGIPVVNVSL